MSRTLTRHVPHYSNELQIEGLIATTSTWLRTETNPQTMRDIIAAYGQVRPNLLQHASGWPTASRLDQMFKRPAHRLADAHLAAQLHQRLGGVGGASVGVKHNPLCLVVTPDRPPATTGRHADLDRVTGQLRVRMQTLYTGGSGRMEPSRDGESAKAYLHRNSRTGR